MLKILFVCHGNICRSPMAEYVMKALTGEAGVSGDFRIASAATSSEEIWNGVGSPIYPPAQRKLMEKGIPFDRGKQARLLVREDYGRFDLIIGMDERNRKNMKRLFGGDPDGKVNLLLDYTDRPREVSDPWYTGDFERAYQDIYEGCKALLDKLLFSYTEGCRHEDH